MLENPERQQRAEAGERQAGENRQRMDEALVENAEHHVDHEDREDEQHQQPLLRRLERLRGAREAGGDARRAASARATRSTSPTASPSDTPGREVERERHRRQLPRVVHRQRPVLA